VVRVTGEGAAAGAGAGAAIVRVEDSGPGITPEILERIFDPFVTTKARGTGLGLVVAQSIVQEHGGELRARNADHGRGATFEVRLPAIEPPTAPAAIAAEVARG
jgi:signal transduction histidine kinase